MQFTTSFYQPGNPHHAVPRRALPRGGYIQMTRQQGPCDAGDEPAPDEDGEWDDAPSAGSAAAPESAWAPENLPRFPDESLTQSEVDESVSIVWRRLKREMGGP